MTRHSLTLAITIASLCIAGCSTEPAAQVSAWSLAREKSGKGFGFSASATLINGDGGWFTPQLLMTDERGCLREERLEAVFPVSAPDPSNVEAKFSDRFDYKWKIAKAEFRLVHYKKDDLAQTEVFRQERVIDPSIKPPSVPDKPCTVRQTQQELRERAKADPEGADAAAIDNMSRNEVIATAINSAGFLCARVTEAFPRDGAIIVSCVEYRNGSGRVKYRVDAGAGRVEQLE